MKITICGLIAASCLLIASFQQANAEACRIEKQATLPITFNSFVPTVPVTINGKTINLGVDTGAQHTVLSPDAVAQLNLPQDPNHTTSIIGSAGNYKVKNVLLNSLVFAGIEHTSLSIAVVSLDHTPSAAVIRDFGAGTSMTGFIGADLLSDYDIEYNPSGHTLSLYHVTGCTKISPPWQGKFIQVPAVVTASNRFAMPVILDGHKLMGIFDTGSSSLELALSSISRAGLTREMLAQDGLQENTGAGGISQKAPSHRFDTFIIAREGFHGLQMSIIDFTSSEADMLIGEDYMHARRFWLSYATKAMFVQRVSTH